MYNVIEEVKIKKKFFKIPKNKRNSRGKNDIYSSGLTGSA